MMFFKRGPLGTKLPLIRSSISMPNISIIIPTYNEEKNIQPLVERLDKALKKNNIFYELIFIDDHSTDQTLRAILSLINKYPIKVYLKEGIQGKAYSLIEGIAKAQYDLVGMIDADLQYPPEAIPKMLELAPKDDLGVVVARRKIYKDSPLRKISSHTFSTVFGRVLHGLNYDIQSGLKLFRKEIVSYFDQSKITPWTFDLSLLITARDLGFGIEEVDIEFNKRQDGESKVNLFKTTYEIARNALKLKFRRSQIYHIPPTEKESMVGAGVVFKRRRLITHSTLHHSESALQTTTTWQKNAFLAVAVLSLLGLILRPWSTVVFMVAILSLIYFLDMIFNFLLVIKSLHSHPEITIPRKQIKELDKDSLPIYSILCPLYKEVKMLPQFLASIKRLDWPENKLDVMLLLEENDKETILAAERLTLPPYVRVVVIPHSLPKTKPKACNLGLSYAKGQYLVIYDAEDRPQSNQLKKAYLGFQKVPQNVVCLQAKLNYYNPHQNLLTKLFTAEYSLWFDVVLTSLQAINTIIPLGGTSNHFKTEVLRKLKGWDPFNVTEDCDLGVRLFKLGYKTAIIDSTTFEEANSHLGNWLRQRSRWIKGYLQTYLVHMRRPLFFYQKYGVHALIFQLIIGARISFMLINPILWFVTVMYFSLHSLVGPTIEALYPTPAFYMAAASAVFGNFMYIYNYMLGCAKRKHWSLIKYVYLIPVYWLAASLAAGIALYQLVVKPHYWEKTIHGFHLKSVILDHPSKLKPGLRQAFSSTFLSINHEK